MGAESEHVWTFIPGVDLTVRVKLDQPVNPYILMGNDWVPEVPARFCDTVDDIGYLLWVFADQCGCNRAFSGSGGRKLAMTLSLRYSSSRYP